MSVRHLGSKTVGAINPGVQTIALPAIAQYVSELATQLADLASQFEQYGQLALTPPNPLQLIAELETVIASLAAQVAGIAASMVPTLGSASLQLGVKIGGINAKLAALRAMVTQLEAALSAGGIHAFAIDSTPAQLSGDLATQIAGGMPGGGLPNARIRGVLLLTEDPAAFAALGALIATG